jgi:hypothetical protein
LFIAVVWIILFYGTANPSGGMLTATWDGTDTVVKGALQIGTIPGKAIIFAGVKNKRPNMAQK